MCCLHGATPTAGGEVNAHGVRPLAKKYGVRHITSCASARRVGWCRAAQCGDDSAKRKTCDSVMTYQLGHLSTSDLCINYACNFVCQCGTKFCETLPCELRYSGGREAADYGGSSRSPVGGREAESSDGRRSRQNAAPTGTRCTAQAGLLTACAQANQLQAEEDELLLRLEACSTQQDRESETQQLLRKSARNLEKQIYSKHDRTELN